SFLLNFYQILLITIFYLHEYLNNYLRSFKFEIKKKKPIREYKPKELLPEELEPPKPEAEHMPEIPEQLHVLKKKFAEELVEDVKKQEKPPAPVKVPKKKVQITEKPKEPMYKPVTEIKEKMGRAQYNS
ncbi:unnamed protein product, partial [marine sediment metagenome]